MPVDIDQRLPNGIAISSGSNEEAEQAWVKHSRSAIESSTEPPDALDWQAFRAAYFPGRRRHDLAAIIAYAAYRHSLKPASSQSTHTKTTEDDRVGVSALRDWEDEGGLLAGRSSRADEGARALDLLHGNDWARAVRG